MMDESKYTIYNYSAQCPMCMKWKDVSSQYYLMNLKNEKASIYKNDFSTKCPDCDIKFTVVVGMNGLQTYELLLTTLKPE